MVRQYFFSWLLSERRMPRRDVTHGRKRRYGPSRPALLRERDKIMSEGAHHIQPATSVRLASGFAVHILTALGAAIALMAMVEAVHERWATMFGWLGLALVVDAIDGPLARMLDIGRTLPNWSGDTLDLVVDFTTYVFVPAYAIMASGLLLPGTATLLGAAIAVSGALYFADRRMKTDDNHFRGFPTLWNAAAFYLFLLKPPPLAASLAMAVLVVATFLPIRVLHPVRVLRWRTFNLALVAIWGLLAAAAVAHGLEPGVVVTAALCLIAIYLLTSDVIFRTIRSLTIR